MQLFEKDKDLLQDEYKRGGTVEDDIVIKVLDKHLISLKKGTSIDDTIQDLLEKAVEIYVLKEDISSLDTLQEEMKIISRNTLLSRVKRFKNDPDKVFAMLFEVNEQLFNDFQASKENHIEMSCITVLLESIIFLIKYDMYHLKNSIPRLKNEYKLSVHSFNVTFYALQIGYFLNFDAIKLMKLGYAAMLHDVGKKKVEAIINKIDDLDLEEFEHIHRHPLYSIDILSQNDIDDPLIVKAILQHHERYDGSGYPYGIKKEKIGEFGAILGLCDVFEALTIDHPYRDGLSSFDSLKLMLTDAVMKNQFNHLYVKKLLLSIGIK